MSDLLRYIGDGESTPDAPPPDDVSHGDLIRLFEAVVLLRTFDERAVSLQRQGRIGTYPTFWGEEATQSGALLACTAEDWIFPSYRQSAIAILRGMPPSTVLKYRRGYGGTHGFWSPRELRVAPITIAIGTHLPHAVGLAWAAKLRGDDVASVVFFGDGATSEGDFHEAMNFAAVFKAPTVFFCTNNQWAISTPVHRQMATKTIAEKAAAYAMPAQRVDGFDPIACLVATRSALQRARDGGGPTLIEAFTYRLAPHATADDPGLYRDEAETARWRRLEPVSRTAAYLKRLGVLDDAAEDKIKKRAAASLASAVKEMEEIDPPGPEVMFDYVYAGSRPWSLTADS